VPLESVKEVEVLPAEEASREVDARAGSAAWIVRAQPPVFVVRVDRPGTDNNFPFYDEALARRVAAELAHAVELCAGHAPAPVAPKPAPPPAKNASLAATMQWIANTLESVGPVNYVAFMHVDQGRAAGAVKITRYSAESKDVRASAPGCRIDWHARRVKDGAVAFDAPVWVPLKDVRQVEGVPAQDAFRETDQKNLRPGSSYRVVPGVLMVRMATKMGYATFPMPDSDLARQMVTALSRAVDACGGGLERY
jgi:hypothetical protein